jgi:hypothetical protein
MTQPNEFVTMRDYGRDVHMTSHQIGQLLKEKGYRNPDGTPSGTARKEGVVEPYSLDSGGYAYRWQVSFLERHVGQRTASERKEQP